MRDLDFPATQQRSSCNLDTNVLAKASAVVSQALRNKIDLLMINKFAKQAAARWTCAPNSLTRSPEVVPVLTAVPKKFLADGEPSAWALARCCLVIVTRWKEALVVFQHLALIDSPSARACLYQGIHSRERMAYSLLQQ
ncbi:DUF2478 domain-containing protein [Bradyrhizobium zhanjiangense]|uniref:DUF2478 domain-containing protein n=1 Tax=Bradyrhizobium zhanjiangense TaxID=1325107 RepID=A0ABY0DG23_9BRAD|nr:DUF2478 domain-containing protein [Bradyrhizobium zhanjiangense]RXG90741.1 DUF2478 domain-containing protein [Bradyrhizobium zhanjiangense]